MILYYYLDLHKLILNKIDVINYYSIIYKLYKILYNPVDYRLAPFYLFVILGYVTLFHHIGSGPYWEHRIGFDRDTCSTYWWANLLFINNYVGGKYMVGVLNIIFLVFLIE